MPLQPRTGRPSRRTVARGAAWTVPAVALAATAPSAVASTDPCATPQGCPSPFADVIVGRTSGGGCAPGQYTVRFSGRIGFDDAKTGSQLSDAVLYLYLPDSSLTFAGSAADGWTVLTRDAGQSSIVDGGTTYYAYSSSYTQPITPTDGTFALPGGGPFTTGCVELAPEYLFTGRSTVVNGAVVTTTGPRTPLPVL